MNKNRTNVTFHGDDDDKLLDQLRKAIQNKDGIEPSCVNALRIAAHFYLKANSSAHK